MSSEQNSYYRHPPKGPRRPSDAGGVVEGCRKEFDPAAWTESVVRHIAQVGEATLHELRALLPEDVHVNDHKLRETLARLVREDSLAVRIEKTRDWVRVNHYSLGGAKTVQSLSPTNAASSTNRLA